MKISRKKIVLGVLGAGVAVALVAGCSGHSSSASYSSAAMSSPDGGAADVPNGFASSGGASSAAGSAAPAGPAAGEGSSGAGQGTRSPAQQVALAPVNRSVIKTSSVAVEIDVKTTGNGAAADNAAVADRVSEVAVQVSALVGSQGFVQSATAKGSTAAIILRVPVDSYDTVMKQISAVGTVTSSQEKAEDVTGQAADLDARVKTMRDSVNKVRALLGQATKISDVIAVESELETRQADLESMEQQLAALSGQVSLSTVTVTLQGQVVGVQPVVVAEQQADNGFVAGLKGGWHALKSFLSGVAALVGAVLPFVPVVAVILFLVLFGRRRWQHRQLPPVPATSGPTE